MPAQAWPALSVPEPVGSRGQCALVYFPLWCFSQPGPDCLHRPMSGSAGLPHGARSYVRHPGILGQHVLILDCQKASSLYPVSFSECCEDKEKMCTEGLVHLKQQFSISYPHHTVLEPDLWILSGFSPDSFVIHANTSRAPALAFPVCVSFRVSCKRAPIIPWTCPFKAWILSVFD